MTKTSHLRPRLRSASTLTPASVDSPTKRFSVVTTNGTATFARNTVISLRSSKSSRCQRFSSSNSNDSSSAEAALEVDQACSATCTPRSLDRKRMTPSSTTLLRVLTRALSPRFLPMSPNPSYTTSLVYLTISVASMAVITRPVVRIR